MGTNYYAVSERNRCDCCGRVDEQRIHIGKNSWGWSFSFRGYRTDYRGDSWFDQTVTENLTSWKEYKEWLRTQKIINEYDVEIKYDDFVALVEGGAAPGRKNINPHNDSEFINQDHINYVRSVLHYSNYSDSYYYWHDEDGYSFGLGEFS